MLVETDKTNIEEPVVAENVTEETAEDLQQQPAQEELTPEQQEYSDKKEAIEIIKAYTDEDDMGELSLRAILGGDILQSRFIRNQVLFVMFCVVLTLLYTGNRYASQQDAIVIDSLRAKLLDTRYNVLTQNSELMNLTRQSNVEKVLRHSKDSLLKESTTPPFLIKADSLR